jgi:hypothetical protein
MILRHPLQYAHSELPGGEVKQHRQRQRIARKRKCAVAQYGGESQQKKPKGRAPTGQDLPTGQQHRPNDEAYDQCGIKSLMLTCREKALGSVMARPSWLPVAWKNSAMIAFEAAGTSRGGKSI